MRKIKGDSDKASIYDIIQAQLLLRLEIAMESGEKFQWVKPWKGAPWPCSFERPDHAFTAAVNYLFLEAGEYLTFTAIKRMHEENPEVKIKKGAKQAYVYQSFPAFRVDKDGNTMHNENGEPILDGFRIRYIREYHISDVENVKSHFLEKEYEHADEKYTLLADEVIRNYAAKYGIVIKTLYGTGKAYSQGTRVVIPEKTQYESCYEYYCTVFHELGHTTRSVGLEEKRRDIEYAQEELVAEMTASLLCAMLHMDDDSVSANSIAYLQGWYEKIKNADSKEIYFAAAEAKKAANFIMDASPRVKEVLMPEIVSAAKEMEWEKDGVEKEGRQIRCTKKIR